MLVVTTSIITVIIIEGNNLRTDAFGQGFEDNNNKNKKYDIVILSQTYLGNSILMI